MTAQNSPVCGAIRSVVPHPTNANIIYAGTVNGGVWKTTSALASSPHWSPLTDNQDSLSIGGLAMDPTDPSGDTLLAGSGRFSSLSSLGGTRLGLLRTTDGGANWTALGETFFTNFNIVGVAARGANLLAGVNIVSGTTPGTIGLYRSTDTGANWTLISGSGGLPAGAIIELVGDPGNAERLYAGVLGTNVGVYRSDNSGATWVNVSPGIVGLSTSSTENIRIAVHDSPGNNVVYVIFSNSGRAAGCFRSPSQGASWADMELPQTDENGTLIGLHPGGQARIHFSLAADPANPNIVYAGGDRQPTSNGDAGGFPNSIGARNFSGRHFRGNFSQPPGSRWTPITNNFAAGGSSPHADSRSLAFDAAGNLIEGDDGGIYKRSNPQSSAGAWTALVGDMQAFETHSAAYDNLSNVCFAGAQDNGTSEQSAADSPVWSLVRGGDGGKVVIDNLSGATTSIRYGSSQNLGGFFRATYDAAGSRLASVGPGLSDTGTGQRMTSVVSAQFYTPVILNTVAPNRLVFLMSNSVWESLDRGDTVTNLVTPGGTPNGAVAGGFSGGVANADVLYIASSSGVRLRSTPGGALAVLGAFPGANARTVAVDTDDWHTVVVGDTAQPAHIWLSRTSGATWSDITGDLSDLDVRQLVIAGVGAGQSKRILSAGRTGVNSTPLDTPGAWTSIAPGLTNAQVMDLRFDPVDRVLCAGTLGRGVWLLSVNACPADFNGDGDVNPDDLGDYITCYFTDPPCSTADFNTDGDVNPDDLGDFITTYFGPAC